jgi:hypothetical protein
MTLLTNLLSQVLLWLTQVVTWFLDDGNELFVIPFAIAIASVIISLVFRAFRRSA